LDSATGILANEATPPEQVVERVYLVLPPEAQRWAREQGMPAPPPAGMSVTRGAGPTAAAPLAIVSPDNGIVYHLSTAVPAAQQQIRLAAVAHTPLAEVTFVLDGQEVAVAGHPYEAFWPLSPGEHRLLAVGRTADGQEVRSELVYFEVVGQAGD